MQMTKATEFAECPNLDVVSALCVGRQQRVYHFVQMRSGVLYVEMLVLACSVFGGKHGAAMNVLEVAVGNLYLGFVSSSCSVSISRCHFANSPNPWSRMNSFSPSALGWCLFQASLLSATAHSPFFR
jgi:hypothetical protein